MSSPCAIGVPFLQRSGDIADADEMVRNLALFDAGAANDQRYFDTGFVIRGFADEIMIAQMITVVTGKNDERVIQLTGLL